MIKKSKSDPAEGGISAEKTELLAVIKQKDGRIEALTRQLESGAELTRMVVHDLKGPLASIMANLDLLTSAVTDRVEREILETAIQGGEDLLNIINTLLEIGKMERGNFELNLSVIDLAGMFKATVGKLKSLARQKSLTLEIDCLSKVPAVAADATLIERIIFNLVMNAIKYTPEGGAITLMTRDGVSKNSVCLAVSDNGIGIPREYQETIFDLYAQVPLRGGKRAAKPDWEVETHLEHAAGGGPAKRRVANVGIGLAFCRLAAEQHGGSIWVESELGKGSTFFVSLPTDLVPSGSGLI